MASDRYAGYVICRNRRKSRDCVVYKDGVPVRHFNTYDDALNFVAKMMGEEKRTDASVGPLFSYAGR